MGEKIFKSTSAPFNEVSLSKSKSLLKGYLKYDAIALSCTLSFCNGTFSFSKSAIFKSESAVSLFSERSSSRIPVLSWSTLKLNGKEAKS